MKKFLHKAKAAFNDHDGANDSDYAPPSYGGGAPAQQPFPTEDQPTEMQAPHPLEVMRYRYQHGTNLGSIFVLEKWLTGSMYAEGSDSSELAAVKGLVKVCDACDLSAQSSRWEERLEMEVEVLVVQC